MKIKELEVVAQEELRRVWDMSKNDLVTTYLCWYALTSVMRNIRGFDQCRFNDLVDIDMPKYHEGIYNAVKQYGK